MTAPLQLRGIACPFDSEAFIKAEGVYETVMPGAFEFVGDVAIQYGSHGGLPVARLNDGSARFFQNSRGLKFEARLPDTWRGLNCYNDVARGSVDKCSVNFTKMETSERMYRLITRARVDHVALAFNAAYASTAVWPVFDDPYDLPPYFRRLDSEWQTGRMLADIEARKRRTASTLPVAGDQAQPACIRPSASSVDPFPNSQSIRSQRPLAVLAAMRREFDEWWQSGGKNCDDGRSEPPAEDDAWLRQ